MNDDKVLNLIDLVQQHLRNEGWCYGWVKDGYEALGAKAQNESIVRLVTKIINLLGEES